MNNLIKTCYDASNIAWKLETNHFPNYTGKKPIEELIQYLVRDKVDGIIFDRKLSEDKKERMETLRSVALCYGGGTDSTIAAYDALKTYKKDEIVLIWVNYGQEYAEKEREAAKFMMEEGFEVVIIEKPLEQRKPEWDYIVPARNLLMASIGSQYADRVWIVGTQRDEGAHGASDKSTEFYQMATQAFTDYYHTEVTVESPFNEITRTEEIALLIKQVGRDEAVRILSHTNTCYHPTGTFCGECKSCYKRYIAMELNGISEDYKVDPLSTDDFWDRAIFKELSYGKERSGDLIALLRKRITQK